MRILSEFISHMPTDTLSPETTDGRDGFLHPYQLSGGVATASVRIILRDFETPKLRDHAARLEAIAAELRARHPRAKIDIEIKKQYRNMRDGLEKEPRAMAKAVEATRAAGLEPELAIIRGGTDGSVLTERGLPTPNLSAGQHNPHSPARMDQSGRDAKGGRRARATGHRLGTREEIEVANDEARMSDPPRRDERTPKH